MTRPPGLTVLDLAVIPEGRTARDALLASTALAQGAEEWGYGRYWLAEHHLTQGIAAVSPLPVLAAVAGTTRRIRIGSGATLTGHRTAVSIAEDFATLAALAPGRVDLGFGRSAARGRAAGPVRPGSSSITGSARFGRRLELLQQAGAVAADHGELVREVRDLLADVFVDADGERWSALPGGAAVELWSLGSSAGESARVAGELALPFAVNHHMSPSTSFAAVEHYRAVLASAHPGRAPRVAVAAEVCVAEDESAAAHRAAAHLEWVRRQCQGRGILPFPRHGDPDVRTDPLVADRAAALVVGTPAHAVQRLRGLAAEFDAEEVVVSILDHDLDRRADAHRLLAAAWRDAAAAA
ncbi:MAG: MsnO8 family LLM class oxidoreductase [Microbacterium sp.]